MIAIPIVKVTWCVCKLDGGLELFRIVSDTRIDMRITVICQRNTRVVTFSLLLRCLEMVVAVARVASPCASRVRQEPFRRQTMIIAGRCVTHALTVPWKFARYVASQTV